MICLKHFRLSVLAAAALLLAAAWLPARSSAVGNAQSATVLDQSTPTEVHLRWGSRPGVSRYRLQLAQDREFVDIVFDRVVSGNEYAITDLPPGRYFWRVAVVTNGPLEFSSAGTIDVSASNQTPDNRVNVPALRPPENLNRVISGNGWRALVGDVSAPSLAHLRSQSALDLVAVSGASIVYALDADNGVSLWTTRLRAQAGGSLRIGAAVPIAPLVVRSRSGLDNILVLSTGSVFALDGSSGREIWRASLPALPSGAVALGAELFVVDNSLRRLFLLDANAGRLVAQSELPGRAFGAPVALDHAGQRGVMIAFEGGRVELRDINGKLLRSGDAGSPATTQPLFVDGPRGGLVLVGTRSGLTAFDANDLRPLGRVALKDDAPRGALAAADLDGDGVVEVIMVTNRGRIVAVNAADGKILWDAAGPSDAQSVTFADVNGDRVVDALVTGGQVFAMALSGRDGSLIWKEDDSQVLVANHAAPSSSRSLIAAPHGTGLLLIGTDPSRMGLRAIEFPRGMVRPGSH